MKNKTWYSLVFLTIVVSCGKKSPIPTPSAAALTYPSQNLACITGTIQSNTESSVTFTWSAADNANTYELHIKNLLTNSTATQTANTNQVTITLLRNTPYSWYVISKSTNTSLTAQSDTWKFYNSGPGVVSHPPFPAIIVNPTYGQNVTAVNNAVNLNWAGSDVDNDIAGYDIYFGTTTAPVLLNSNVTNTHINSVAVIPNNNYYWRVITKDWEGNTSDSGVFKFKIN